MEGPFWALEGRWNCRRGRTNFCLRFVSACALDKMAWPAIASGSAGVRDPGQSARVDVGTRYPDSAFPQRVPKVSLLG